jgi:hypothetical protein
MLRKELGVFGLLAFVALLGLPRIAQAAEDYDNCTGTITSLPAVINSQGTWCLKHNLTTSITSGDAILINTNNVTIDCNNFMLDGSGAGTGTLANGIHAANRLNATVRNCSIRGFGYGIDFFGISGGGHAIEDSRFDGNTLAGIFAEGDGSVVRRNRVLNSGPSTVISYAYGIDTQYSVDILDNVISGVTVAVGGNGSASGIVTVNNLTGRISGNAVRALAKDGTGTISGVVNVSPGHIFMRGNDVVGDASAGSIGLRCGSSQGSARDNVISGFATALQSCTDSGGNDIAP